MTTPESAGDPVPPLLQSDRVVRLVAIINRMHEMREELDDVGKRRRATIARLFAHGASRTQIATAVEVDIGLVNKILDGVRWGS